MTKEYRYTVPFDISNTFEGEVSNYLHSSHHEEVRRLACSGYVFLQWKAATNLLFDVPMNLSGRYGSIEKRNKKIITLRFTNPNKYEENSSLNKMFNSIYSLGIGIERSSYIRKLMLNGFIYESLSLGEKSGLLPDFAGTRVMSKVDDSNSQPLMPNKLNKVKSHLGGLM